jgi:hypothetical protein
MEPANGGSGLLISSRERLDLPRETEGLPNCLQRLQSSAWHIWVMIGKSGKMSFSEVTLVASYSVVAERNRDPNNTLGRHLYLEADSSASGTFKHFALYFSDDPPSLGYVNPDNGYVVPFLLLKDFSDIYHIVQAERPVYTSFFADDDKELQWFQVRTALEPTGEGPIDFR